MPRPPASNAMLSKLVKNMKRRGNDPLRPLLDQYLIERRNAPERYKLDLHDLSEPVRPGGRISPSDLCGCERAAAFKFLGIRGRRDVDPDQELVLDDGNWRHLKWQSIFRDMELVLGADRCKVLSIEKKVSYDDLYVAGSLDASLLLRPNPRAKRLKWVVDIKGINERGFNWIVREDAPIPKHVKQLVAYERSVGIPRGILWYENKNNQHTKAFIVRYDDGAWNEVQSWCRSVISFMKRERLPHVHPDCDRGEYTFGRCPYARLCFGRKPLEEVERLAYDAFEGIEAAWEAGHEEWNADGRRVDD